MRPWSTRLACNSGQSKPALPHRLVRALDSVFCERRQEAQRHFAGPTPTDGHHDHQHQQRRTFASANRMACRLHVRAEPMAARFAQHADALPRACANPLDGRQQRPPGEYPELRTFGELLGSEWGFCVPVRHRICFSLRARRPWWRWWRSRWSCPVKLRQALRGPHRVRGPLRAAVRCRSGLSLPVIFASGRLLVMAGTRPGRWPRPSRVFRPLDAYRFDILGSIGGIVAVLGALLLGAPTDRLGM